MIILVSTVPVAANIANIASVTMAPTLPSMTCTIVWSIGTPVMLEIVTRVSIMTGDAMVLLAMWRAIGGLPKVTAVLHAKVSIASRLLRDGTLYFSALLLMNALVLALYILPTNFAGKNMGSLPDIAAVVLLSRLFLNLREAAFSPATVLSTTEAQMSASDLTFARVLGVLGSSMIEEDSCHSEELESSGDGETCEAEVSGDEHIADEGSGAAEFKTITIHSSGDNGLLEAADGSPRGRQGASADKDPLIKLLERIA
ncbi:uncharacterized protein C8Q71DRAFT_426498 [Rhodofomes roseus]|uniref:Uncharacterized protein n=1 Tax=Rhodofomes roseus TaxID=34475 RepID=A0ABQ8KRU8_9APHY|nr:uncharacterized protein C8Q71DRAFT_426498 [Rhodofomes roseus]KAH9840850.1 hypothetical protein C8Q71DRAFT_426498 [Rhodofomes roseus]